MTSISPFSISSIVLMTGPRNVEIPLNVTWTTVSRPPISAPNVSITGVSTSIATPIASKTCPMISWIFGMFLITQSKNFWKYGIIFSPSCLPVASIACLIRDCESPNFAAAATDSSDMMSPYSSVSLRRSLVASSVWLRSGMRFCPAFPNMSDAWAAFCVASSIP